MFSKCQIALDLDTSVPFKRKAAIKRQIIDNDGVISYIVSKKVTLPSMSVPLCINSDLVARTASYTVNFVWCTLIPYKLLVFLSADFI